MRHWILLGLLLGMGLAQAQLPGRVVSVDWLVSQVGNDDVRIIDARSPESYGKGHIKGSVSLPVNATFGPDPRSDLAAPASVIRALFGQAGIDRGIPVIVYDDGDFIDAARLIWMLESYGHKQVAILNGGYPGWVHVQAPATTDVTQVVPRRFVPAIDPKRLATKFSTRMAIHNPGVAIIDARSQQEYEGLASKGARSGHIPSAINIPWDDNFDTQNGVPRLKPFEELAKLYAGLDKSTPIITYCNKGKQSALTHFILRELGYEAAAYDGSWYEWSNDPSLPITQRQKP